MSFLRINRGGSRYGRVGGRSNSLADENDFGIHDDLLEDGGEEEDAKVLHDNGNYFLFLFLFFFFFLFVFACFSSLFFLCD